MRDETQSAEFYGPVEARVPSASEWGWRGGGSGSVSVSRDGVEFRVYTLSRLRRQVVPRDELAHVYPVRARAWSVRNLLAPSDTGIRFVTRPAGLFQDRDVYLFYSYHREEQRLIDLLASLGYPVDRRCRTLRLYWGEEK